MTLQLAYATSQLGDPAEALSTYKVTTHGQTRLRITASKVCRQWKPAPEDLCWTAACKLSGVPSVDYR